MPDHKDPGPEAMKAAVAAAIVDPDNELDWLLVDGEQGPTWGSADWHSDVAYEAGRIADVAVRALREAAEQEGASSRTGDDKLLRDMAVALRSVVGWLEEHHPEIDVEAHNELLCRYRQEKESPAGG